MKHPWRPFLTEFKQGMAARAEILGINGANHPDNWLGDLANPALHAIAILFARDETERERCRKEHANYLAQLPGVQLLSSLDLAAIHSVRLSARTLRLSRSTLAPDYPTRASVRSPSPGPETPLKAGEFFLGYTDESGVTSCHAET